jgi:hypothetical protein
MNRGAAPFRGSANDARIGTGGGIELENDSLAAQSTGSGAAAGKSDAAGTAESLSVTAGSEGKLLICDSAWVFRTLIEVKAVPT